MAEEEPIIVNHGTIIPSWMKWLAGVAGTSFVGLVVAGTWGLVGGGIDSYVEERAFAVVKATQVTDDGKTQAQKINELTMAVGQLTTAINTSETRDAEFRSEVRGRLDSLTGAVMELSQ